MISRSAILAALRGAKACAGCARYGAVDPFAKAAVGCPECQAALADAVLAAIQPPGGTFSPVLTGQINASPEPLKSFVRDLETQPDPAQYIRDAYAWKENAEALAARVRELEAVSVPASCGHPAACATTPDNPPHAGSTWTCAWCADRAGLLVELRAALRKARADALRTAADTLAATCVTLGATVDLRLACQLLRRLADDAEAGT